MPSLLVSQLSVTGACYTCQPYLAGFVNGLPLVVIELKKPGVPARAAFRENLRKLVDPESQSCTEPSVTTSAGRSCTSATARKASP